MKTLISLFTLCDYGVKGDMPYKRPKSLFSSTCRQGDSLRICLLSYRSNPFCGGQGVYIRYLSRALVELGHRVDVISGEPYPQLDEGVNLIPLPGMNFYGYERTLEAVRDRGIRSFTDAIEFLGYNTGGFPEPYTFGRRVVKFFKENSPSYDIVHDNQSLAYGLLNIAREYPLVCTIHHPITRDLTYALAHEKSLLKRLLLKRWHSFLRMQKKVAPLLPLILTVSRASQEDIIRDFNISPSKVRVIYNGVDLETFTPRRDIPQRPFSIISTASADVPLKGLNFLISALGLLKERFEGIKLMVIGSVKKQGPTYRLIRKLGLESHVEFKSGISHKELVEEYARACVAVVPSLYEGFGLPALEALSCGKALVCTTGGALPEVVGDCAILVPPGSSTELARAIAYLFENEDLCKDLGNRARKRVEKMFNWRDAALSTVEAYKEAIGIYANS